MGDWYRVIKTIKGRGYAYLQRTWREGKRVRTENRYLGPADGRSGNNIPQEPEPFGAEPREYKSAEAVISELNGRGVSIPHYIKKDMRGQQFSLRKVLIDEILAKDPDVRQFVEAFEGTAARRKSAPIIIGAWQGNNQAVMDGWHRLAALKNSGATDIVAYVSIKAQLTDFYQQAPKPDHVDPELPLHGKVAYHGARAGITGTLEPSAAGTFGPGFYLTTRQRAEDYAKYDGRLAANPAEGLPLEPQHAGTVHAFDLSGVRLKVLETWLAYFDLVDEILQVDQGYATPEDKARVQELLAAEGYDGIEVRDPDRTETVIFPASLHKIKEIHEVNTTRSPW